MSKPIDITGEKFGKLTVLSREGSDKAGRALWKCQCECGNTKIILGKSLRNNQTLSCGCLIGKRQVKQNSAIICGDTVEMFTGNGESFIIDKDDYNRVKQYRWYKTNNGYIFSKQSKTLLHRLIVNCEDDMVVDHINHNKTDNRRSNLRICTKAENCKNHLVSKRNVSGTTGVCWCDTKKQYRAYICINGKQTSLGYYNDIQSAISARKKAETAYYKEYAYKEETA